MDTQHDQNPTGDDVPDLQSHECHVLRGTPRPVLPEQCGDLDMDGDPLEVYVSTQQRYWIDARGMFGITLKGGVNGEEVLGIVYDQIEDLQNALGPIYSLFLTLECMEVVPEDRQQWCEYMRDFDAPTMRECLIARVEEICEGLKAGAISFLGLNLEKFKGVMEMMMVPGFRGGVDAYSVARGGTQLRRVFFGTEDPSVEPHDEAFFTQEALDNRGRYYYYPDGNCPEMMVDQPLEKLRPQIEALKKLDGQHFIAAIFEDILDSIRDNGVAIEEAPRYQGGAVFSRAIFQKLFAVHFAIRTCLEEDEQIFLQGENTQTTLRAIKEAIRQAREMRKAQSHGGEH